jgi:hypothetical protein
MGGESWVRKGAGLSVLAEGAPGQQSLGEESGFIGYDASMQRSRLMHAIVPVNGEVVVYVAMVHEGRMRGR